MVAGHEIGVVDEVPQRFGVAAEIGHRPVDQVPDDGDDVRPRRVDRGHETAQVRSVDQRSEVDVGDGGDREAVERGIEPVEHDLAPLHPRASGLDRPVGDRRSSALPPCSAVSARRLRKAPAVQSPSTVRATAPITRPRRERTVSRTTRR